MDAEEFLTPNLQGIVVTGLGRPDNLLPPP